MFASCTVWDLSASRLGSGVRPTLHLQLRQRLGSILMGPENLPSLPLIKAVDAGFSLANRSKILRLGWARGPSSQPPSESLLTFYPRWFSWNALPSKQFHMINNGRGRRRIGLFQSPKRYLPSVADVQLVLVNWWTVTSTWLNTNNFPNFGW